MFEHTSRYAAIETATYTTEDGRQLVFVRRRFLPPAAPAVVLAEHRVADGERLDQIAARYLGDPELFWQICDANDAMQPDELAATPGRCLLVALPEV